jgi:hypothetical protein
MLSWASLNGPETLILLELCELLGLFEAEIVIFPFRPGIAPLRRASNWPELLTLIMATLVCALVIALRAGATFPSGDKALELGFELGGLATTELSARIVAELEGCRTGDEAPEATVSSTSVG